MESKVVTEHLFAIEIDGVEQGSVKAANPSPQTLELSLESFDALKDGKPHQILLTEMPASEYAAAEREIDKL